MSMRFDSFAPRQSQSHGFKLRASGNWVATRHGGMLKSDAGRRGGDIVWYPGNPKKWIAGTAKNDASLNRFELCSIFGGVIKSLRARHLRKSRREWSTGIRPSQEPWIRSVAQETLPIILMLGKRSRNVKANARPTIL